MNMIITLLHRIRSRPQNADDDRGNLDLVLLHEPRGPTLEMSR